ncbi:unnamed protein product [Protopolystoma xenopodis]|uniref:NOMO C-terminal transthyretin-like domain-containing protein n=1 Tax=Protopolystoma xenopodis TaxID=117903 RepID=A0A3S5AUL1_9PLAT|nr:unnamed protein product [Protopolystoma xenopodis]
MSRYDRELIITVRTRPEFLKTLRLLVFDHARPHSPIFVHKFANQGLFMLSGVQLTAMSGSDHVFRLETSLKESHFLNITSQTVIIRPEMDVSHSHRFEFSPSPRPTFGNIMSY